MTISTAVSYTNNALIFKATHKDYKSQSGSIMYANRMLTPDELPQKEYVHRVKTAHRKNQKKVVATFLRKHLKTEFGDGTKRYVDHEMNQWLNSKKDVLAHFKAFGREVPVRLIEAFKTETVVFPDDLVFE